VTEHAVWSHTSIAGRVADLAAVQPQALALSWSGGRLTYGELDRRAAALAARLTAAGVRPGLPVAILMRRSADLVVAALAVLRAGARYLPLHDTQPADRVRRIMQDSGAVVLLTDEFGPEDVRRLHAGRVMTTGAADGTGPAAAPPPPPRTADPVACVVYTSGSTGAPKGVEVTQSGVLDFAADPCWATGRHRRTLMVAPFAFSVHLYELWVPLLNGWGIALAPHGGLDTASLAALIREHEVTALHLAAGLFRVVAEEAPESLAGVREVLTGGDVVAPSAVRRIQAACPGIVVRATYGATETTLFTLTRVLADGQDPGPTVMTGQPMAAVVALVLDAERRPCAPGTPGELHLGGPRLALGYAGRPDFTEERFFSDPSLAGGMRLYRSGDRARRTADGGVELLGRMDRQVKIRGFRVEPAEVEAALLSNKDVSAAVVVPRPTPSGDTALLACVATGPGTEAASLEAALREVLPDYMVPGRIITVRELPLTPNGKIDRDALLASEPGPTGPRSPADEQRELLRSVFAGILGRQVGDDDDFFACGGQSLDAMRLVSRLRRQLRTDVDLEDLFDCPTVASLDDLISTRRSGAPK